MQPLAIDVDETGRKRSEKNRRARLNRIAREESYRSIGMRKVRGNLGGTHWE
jgi:hypothetical protein